MATTISPEQAEAATEIARQLEARKARRNALRAAAKQIPRREINKNAESRQRYERLKAQLQEADSFIAEFEKEHSALLAVGRLLLFKENFHAKR